MAEKKKVKDCRKSGMKCAIVNCCRSYRINEKIQLFRFPKDPYYRSLWVSKCKIGKNIDINRARICNVHFEKECIGSNMLKRKAVPTKKLFDMKSNCIQIDTAPPVQSDPYKYVDVQEAILPQLIRLNKKKAPEQRKSTMPFDADTSSTDCINEVNISVESLLAFKEPCRAKLWADIDATPNTQLSSNGSLNSSGEFCNNCLKREQNEAFYRKKYYDTLVKNKAQRQTILRDKRKIVQLRKLLQKEREKEYLIQKLLEN